MAVTLEELQIKFTAQMGGLQSDLNGVKKQLNGMTASVNSTSNSFVGLARAAKLFISAVVVRGMVKVGQESIKMANEVVESESLFTVSMKGMADSARAWSEELSASLGLNAYNLRRNVGTFNTMFMSMGLGEKAAYDMSTSLVQLAEDMASFYNVDPEEMFTKLRAGITGETEPLKRLGIMVDENTTKQYALSEGISKTGKNLTQTEKLMARYAAIMAQTANAQGDLARTINSPVNQIRLLNNQLDQAKIALGQAFMPIQAAVLPILNSLAKAATIAAQALAYLMGSLGGYGGVGVFANKAAAEGANTNKELTDSLNDSAKAYKKAGGAAKKAAKDANVGLKAFDEINKLTDEKTKAGGGIDEIDVPDITPANGYAEALQVISDKVRAAAEDIKKFWEGLKNSALGLMVEGAFDALKWLWTDVIKPFGEWALANPNTIGNVLGGIGAGILTWNVGKMLNGGGALAKIGAAIAGMPGLAVMVGITAGLVMIGGAINSAAQSAVDAENDNRFGKLSISLEKLRNLTSQISTPFSKAMENLKEDFEALKTAGGELRSLADLNAELIYGYHLKPEALTKDRITELIASVQSEVDKNKDLLGSAQIKATMGLEALFAGTSQDGSEILKLNQSNWEAVKEEGAKLGKEYLDAVTSAAFDGVISAEEQKKIYNLQQKLLEMTMLATDPDVVIAKMQIRKMGLNFDGATLTPDTVKSFNKALDERQGELMALLDEQGTSTIDYALAVAIQANPNVSDAELKKIQDATQLALSEQKLIASWEIEQVRISAPFAEVQKAYKDVLDKSRPAIDALNKNFMTDAIEIMLKKGFKARDINTAAGQKELQAVITDLMSKGLSGAQMPTGPARQAVEDWLELFKPNYSEWQAMASEYKRLGLTVPTELASAISDYEAMQAITLSASELIDYVNAQANIDTSTWSEEGKAVAAAVAKALDDGKIDVKTAAGLLAKAAAGELGSESTTGVGENFGQGFINGILAKIAGAKAAAAALSKAATGSMRVTLLEKSPSKVTLQSGLYFGEGFALGIDDMKDRVYGASKALAKDAAAGLGGLNTTMGLNTNSSLTLNDGGIAGAISSGIEQGVQRVMSALNINLNVDGERFGSAAIRTINDTQRAAGRLLLEM
jgi:hypothetical protein